MQQQRLLQSGRSADQLPAAGLAAERRNKNRYELLRTRGMRLTDEDQHHRIRP